MRRIVQLAVLCLSGLLLAGCAGSPNFLQSASPIAGDEAALFRILLGVSAVIFIVVEGLLVYNIFRFRARPGREAIPFQRYRAIEIETVYTFIPIVIVIGAFILTVRTMGSVAAPAPSPDDVNVHVYGHRWWWEFEYTDQKITTANEIHIPIGTNVQLTLDSVDVIHSFYVPQLSGKTDVIPGQTNHMWLRGDTVGEYHGQCSEYCGLNHANMRFTVFVDTPQDYQKWLANQQKPLFEAQTDLQKKGEILVTQGICASCHLIGDYGEEHVAPSLTHLFSRARFAGDILDLNETNLRRWLNDNQAIKPGNDMIHVKSLPQSQIDALVAYLMQLK